MAWNGVLHNPEWLAEKDKNDRMLRMMVNLCGCPDQDVRAKLIYQIELSGSEQDKEALQEALALMVGRKLGA